MVENTPSRTLDAPSETILFHHTLVSIGFVLPDHVKDLGDDDLVSACRLHNVYCGVITNLGIHPTCLVLCPARPRFDRHAKFSCRGKDSRLPHVGMDDSKGFHKHVEEVFFRERLHGRCLAEILLDKEVPINDILARGLVGMEGEGTGILVGCLANLVTKRALKTGILPPYLYGKFTERTQGNDINFTILSWFVRINTSLSLKKNIT